MTKLNWARTIRNPNGYERADGGDQQWRNAKPIRSAKKRRPQKGAPPDHKLVRLPNGQWCLWAKRGTRIASDLENGPSNEFTIQTKNGQRRLVATDPRLGGTDTWSLWLVAWL